MVPANRYLSPSRWAMDAHIKQVDKGCYTLCSEWCQYYVPRFDLTRAMMTPAEKNTVLLFMAEGKEHALAIGITTLSTEDIAKINKGIGVENCHYLNDGLWKMKPIKPFVPATVTNRKSNLEILQRQNFTVLFLSSSTSENSSLLIEEHEIERSCFQIQTSI
ncbi:hypothetical protein DOY81_009268 [Sarcophaga bullata]|nr:hypothetical protein DOY81_009268 [Sarcophaga bullata]